MLFTLLLTNFVWCVWNVWNKILLTQGNLPDQFHKVRKPQNRTMPTGTQPQIWKVWWTKNCPTSTSKVPYKFCQVIAFLLTPAKNPLISFNKNTSRPHLTLSYPLPQVLPLHQETYFSQNQMQPAISSFPHGSGAGPEGLRPQHYLKDCISISAGDASTSLLTSLTEFVNHLTNGHLPTALRPFLYGAQLHGLRKNNGDLRLIAVGCTYRRLVAKVCLRPYISRLHELLQPSQLGVGTPRGCEAAVLATRSFIAQTQGEKVLLKLDVKMPSTAFAETKFFK